MKDWEQAILSAWDMFEEQDLYLYRETLCYGRGYYRKRCRRYCRDSCKI